MKYISICSGIEAATVAWHGLGWTPLAFSEIEAFPSAVLAARWPQVPNLGDMTKFAEWPEDILAECDLLVGGPPCQAFSVAGLRKSLDDDRGNITLAYVRLLSHIDEVRKRHGRPPAIAVYENVPGLLSTKDNAFGCLIGALAGCDEAPKTETGKWPKAGYVCGETRRVGYRILDAQFFGVAQRRRRVFLVAVPCELVASLGDNACPSEILSLRESVRGNPPTRSKAGQGTAAGTEGRPRIGGDPCGRVREVSAVGVGGQCAGTLDSHYFKGCGSAAFGEREVVAAVYPCLDANVDAKWGSNQWVDGGFPILEAFGGNNTSGPIDAAAALLAHGGSVGRLDFASETFAVVPEVANPLTHRMHKGINTTVDEGQTPIVTAGSIAQSMRESGQGFWVKDEIAGTLRAEGEDRPSRPSCVIAQSAPNGFPDPAYAISAGAQSKGGVFGSGRDSQDTFVVQANAVAIPINADADRQNSEALKPSPDAEGRIRLRNPGIGIGGDGDPMFTVQATKPHAVAYVKATNPHSKEEAPRYEEAAVSACLNGWDERHDPPKHVVAFTQNTRDEVRQINGDGQIAGSLSADSGSHQTNYVAFKESQSGCRTGDVHATIDANKGSRRQEGVVCLPTPLQEVSKRTGKSTDDPRAGIGIGSAGDPMYTLQAGAQHGCLASMQVRRLTPSECEFLQGFPADHTDIIFRKKPAADGPRYRALGNSMAVPCMFWLGYRIHKATK